MITELVHEFQVVSINNLGPEYVEYKKGEGHQNGIEVFEQIWIQVCRQRNSADVWNPRYL